jgi:cobalt-zinc-cadmium efflux system protein
MSHNHSHSHQKNYGKAFAIGIILNTAYVAIEAFYGLVIDSSALLADAGHNASDVLSLILAWGAIWVAKSQPNQRYTFGLRKATIMASMINGMLIIGASGFILWDAIQKIQNPVEIPGNTVMIVAGIGLIVNTGTALMFMRDQHDLNIKGAFLHMAADAGVTLGVLIGGLVIKFTDAYWVDPLLSFLIVIVILYSAWGLLSDSVKLAVDAVPKNIDIKEVANFLRNSQGVESIHDLHIWAMSTTENALSVHLVIHEDTNQDLLLKQIKHKLKESFDIHHSTIQIELNKINDSLTENHE